MKPRLKANSSRAKWVQGQLLSSVLGLCALGVFTSDAKAVAQEVASRSVVSPGSVSSTSVKTTAPTNSADAVLDPASLIPDLPPLPRSKASLIGGTIKKVDRVRDQLTLQIFGAGKMKVLFDPRTQIFRGETPGSTPDLHLGDRVYVDTILDGSNIFAKNIRVAGAAADGHSQGVVVSYHADKNELVLRDLLSPDPVKLRLTSDTLLVQDGRPAFASQLVPGTLVDVNFVTQKNSRDLRQISILAVPGSDFTFGGEVVSLDLHIGLLVLKSSSDHKTYEIYLDPSVITIDDRLRSGADVTTVANFDGSRYVARSLTVNSAK